MKGWFGEGSSAFCHLLCRLKSRRNKMEVRRRGLVVTWKVDVKMVHFVGKPILAIMVVNFWNDEMVCRDGN